VARLRPPPWVSPLLRTRGDRLPRAVTGETSHPPRPSRSMRGRGGRATVFGTINTPASRRPSDGGVRVRPGRPVLILVRGRPGGRTGGSRFRVHWGGPNAMPPGVGRGGPDEWPDGGLGYSGRGLVLRSHRLGLVAVPTGSGTLHDTSSPRGASARDVVHGLDHPTWSVVLLPLRPGGQLGAAGLRRHRRGGPPGRRRGRPPPRRPPRPRGGPARGGRVLGRGRGPARRVRPVHRGDGPSRPHGGGSSRS
jgi:hypothetical protein